MLTEQDEYKIIRSSGLTSFEEAEELVGHELSSEGRRAVWNNKEDENLELMGR